MNSNSIYTWLAYASTSFSIVSFLVGCIRIRHIRLYLVPVFVITTISAIVEFSNFIFVSFTQNNLFVLHLYTIAEFTCLSLFYRSVLKEYSKVSWINLLIPVFILLAYFDYKENGVSELDSLSTTVESVCMVICSLYLFYQVISKLIINKLVASPVFWINSGILLYFSGNLLLFAFSNKLAESNTMMYFILWTTIHSFLNIIYNISLSIGFWKAKSN